MANCNRKKICNGGARHFENPARVDIPEDVAEYFHRIAAMNTLPDILGLDPEISVFELNVACKSFEEYDLFTQQATKRYELGERRAEYNQLRRVALFVYDSVNDGGRYVEFDRELGKAFDESETQCGIESQVHLGDMLYEPEIRSGTVGNRPPLEAEVKAGRVAAVQTLLAVRGLRDVVNAIRALERIDQALLAELITSQDML